MRQIVSLFLAAAIAIPAIVAAPAPASAQMFLDRFSAQCKKGALYGAAAGGVLGALASKDKNRVENAVLGAAVGGIAGCVILQQLTKSDNDRLLALQKKAAKKGVPVTDGWTNASKTKVMATAYPGPIQGGCRDIKVDLSVNGEKAQAFDGDRFCKKGSTWTLQAA